MFFKGIMGKESSAAPSELSSNIKVKYLRYRKEKIFTTTLNNLATIFNTSTSKNNIYTYK